MPSFSEKKKNYSYCGRMNVSKISFLKSQGHYYLKKTFFFLYKIISILYLSITVKINWFLKFISKRETEETYVLV